MEPAAPVNETSFTPLPADYRVVDLTDGIAGAYCTKILADAGAEVIKLDPPGGGSLWHRSASGAPVDGRYGGVLHQYLSCSKSSVVVDLASSDDLALARDMIKSADAVVWSAEGSLCQDQRLSVDQVRAFAPNAAILALSAYGLDSVWAARPANEFVLQALSGSAWNHGSPDDTPVMIGGSHGEYAAGTVGALALLVARQRQRQGGQGDLIDVAMLEVLHLSHTMFPVTFFDLTKRPYRPRRYDSIPGIHRTKDGWVGLWVTTGQQWLDFCSMIERPDWSEDPSLGLMDNRASRHDELHGYVDEWAACRTTEEIVEFASLLRLPVAAVGNGATLPAMDHFVERAAYLKHPRTGVAQPDVWYTFSSSADRRPPQPSSALGEDTDACRRSVASSAHSADPRPVTQQADTPLPFAGLRVLDMTAFWAGPIITHPLAMLGADVIHIESAKRPDGIRMAATIPMTEPGWWETSPFFNGTNTCKRDLAVDLQSDAGRAALLRLVEECDVVVENYSPRVMDQLGLGYDTLRVARPDIIVVRAPAFGLSGPWRDRVAYAPTIDEAAGLAWVTGAPDGPPSMVGAASDAIGGLHGTIALLLALEHRQRTGEGTLVETPQVGAGIQVTAEQVIEYSANGVLLERVGNRSWTVAPQGVYRSLDRDQGDQGVPKDDWVAISVRTDAEWMALASLIGDQRLSADPTLRTVEGRRSAHDRLDEAITAWTCTRSSDEAAATICESGIAAAAVVPPHLLADIEPIAASGFYETVRHPVAGPMRVPAFPARFSGGPKLWNQRPAPCLGEHNRAVLSAVAGFTSEEIDTLVNDGVVGDKTEVNLGW